MKSFLENCLTRIMFMLAVAMIAVVAEARPRHGNPAAGQVLNGVFQGLSQVQRDAEKRAKQEETNRLRREKEWQRQQDAEQRRLQKEADNRARQLELQRKKAEAEAAKAEAQRLREQERLSELNYQRNMVALEQERTEAVRNRREPEKKEDSIGGISLDRWQVYLAAAALILPFLIAVFKK